MDGSYVSTSARRTGRKEPIMNLREQLTEDLKNAMRQQDGRRKTAIRSVIAALKQAETELDARGQRKSLNDDDILALITKQAKQRQESIVEYRRGGREDLVAEEEAELAILQAYLPQQLTADEIEAQARQIIAQVGASGPQEIGKVMRPLMAKLKGRADGRLVNQVVQKLLSG
jgi:uncharacterized protein YqeY